MSGTIPGVSGVLTESTEPPCQEGAVINSQMEELEHRMGE